MLVACRVSAVLFSPTASSSSRCGCSRGCGELCDADFRCLALAFNRTRHMHPYFLTAWVFLPDHWRAICAPRYPLTISVASGLGQAGGTITWEDSSILAMERMP